MRLTPAADPQQILTFLLDYGVRAERRLKPQTTCRRFGQPASPRGLPRRRQRRTASDSCSKSGPFTRATRFGGRAIGQRGATAAGAEKYCRYGANLIRIIQRFLLGVDLRRDGSVVLAPTATVVGGSLLVVRG